MSDENYAIFNGHLKAVKPDLRHRECPICGETKWQADGPTEGRVSGSLYEVMPMAVLICVRCYYARPFAWIPIKDAHARRQQQATRGAQPATDKAEGTKP